MTVSQSKGKRCKCKEDKEMGLRKYAVSVSAYSTKT